MALRALKLLKVTKRSSILPVVTEARAVSLLGGGAAVSSPLRDVVALPSTSGGGAVLPLARDGRDPMAGFTEIRDRRLVPSAKTNQQLSHHHPSDKDIGFQLNIIFRYGTHTQTESTHTKAGSTHTQTESTHAQVGGIHTQEGSMHTQAGSTHTQTGSTHTQAGSTHAYGGSTHTQAGSTHTQAGSTHAQGGSTHTQTGSTHTQVGSTHATAGSSVLDIPILNRHPLIQITRRQTDRGYDLPAGSGR